MQRQLIAAMLMGAVAVSPVFAAKSKTVSHRTRDYGVSTLLKRQQHLTDEIQLKTKSVSAKLAKKPNKKMQQQLSYLHRAVGDANHVVADLTNANKYTRRR